MRNEVKEDDGNEKCMNREATGSWADEVTVCRGGVEKVIGAESDSWMLPS